MIFPSITLKNSNRSIVLLFQDVNQDLKDMSLFVCSIHCALWPFILLKPALNMHYSELYALLIYGSRQLNYFLFTAPDLQVPGVVIVAS